MHVHRCDRVKIIYFVHEVGHDKCEYSKNIFRHKYGYIKSFCLRVYVNLLLHTASRCKPFILDWGPLKHIFFLENCQDKSFDHEYCHVNPFSS
jgi:hypothetical protein